MMPTAPSADDRAFVVQLAEFSGPLDLLLTLIRDQEIDVTDIPIAQIADQFVAAIHQLGLNQAADYLEMAARLLRIKAQMLLPRRGDDDAWEDPRHELVRRLLEYQQIREVVDWMERAARRRADAYGRGWQAPAPEAPPPPLTFSIEELLFAVERVLAMIPDAHVHEVVPRPLNVEAATRKLLDVLAERDRFTWRELLGERPSVVDVLSSLVALLEVARRGLCLLQQPAPFAPLEIARGTAYQAA